MLDPILKKRLQRYQQANLYRERTVMPNHCISFCSNDYLGLAIEPKVVTAFKKAAEKFGVGSTASSLVNGYKQPHQALEIAFANFLQRDRALLFSSGYMANLGVLQALVGRGDSIYQDKLNHASLMDAALLTRAKVKRYRHRDSESLKILLQQQHSGRPLIATDGVFSMSGQLAPLPKLADIANKQQVSLLVDDAHGIGVLGKFGRGITEHFNLSQTDVPILICPMGKAFGCMGAIVAGSEVLIETLIQFARTYIYSTALPPAIAAAALASLTIIQTETWRRERLNYLIKYFQQGAGQRNLKFLFSETPIQSLVVGDAKQTLQLSQQLLKRGFWVTAIRPPTVPVNSARLRITLNCWLKESQIDQLLDILADNHVAL